MSTNILRYSSGFNETHVDIGTTKEKRSSELPEFCVPKHVKTIHYSHVRTQDFDVEEIPTFYKALQDSGYWTMITGRDDLTKRTGPGLNGTYHTVQQSFSYQLHVSNSCMFTALANIACINK